MIHILAGILAAGRTVSWSLNAGSVDKTALAPGFCYAMVQYDTDGVEYQNSNAEIDTADSSRGAYIDVPSMLPFYYISYEVNSGTGGTLTDNIGTYPTRVALNADRWVKLAVGGVGTGERSITVRIHNASSGGSVVESATLSLIVDNS